MSKKEFNTEFNKGYGIRPQQLPNAEKRERKARRTKIEANLCVCVGSARGAFIWDVCPSSYQFRGLCVVKNIRGYEIYAVYQDERFYIPTHHVEQQLAEMFPQVWDMDLLIPTQEDYKDIPF